VVEDSAMKQALLTAHREFSLGATQIENTQDIQV
jgi:hypothetical protein